MSERNSRGSGVGRRQTARKGSAGRLLLVVLGFLAALILIIALLIKIFVKPPEISPDPDKSDVSQPVVNPDKPNDGIIDVIQLERREEFYTLLVCGTDKDKSRTDTIMVVSYDVKGREVNVCSIPRDTLSNVDNRKLKKINAAFTTSIEELELEIERLLGYPIDRYVVVDYQGFADVIDAIGGVDYNVPMNMYHEDGETVINLKKGYQNLNGEEALQFVRFRAGYADQDLGRIHAQQDFIKAVAKQLLSPSSILNITDIAEAVFDNTKTNLTLGEMAWFASNALGLKMDGIKFTTLPGESQYLYYEPLGYNQWYYVPNETKILEMVNSGFNPYTTEITDLDLIDLTKYTPGK